MEGLSHRGVRRPPLLVLPPLPQEGGGMDHIVGAELAFAASSNGHPTVRFNYRGVGASQGSRSTGAALLDDALAALLLAEENAEMSSVLVASIGQSDVVALALAERAGSRVAGLVLITPSSDANALASLEHPHVIVVPQLGYQGQFAGLSNVTIIPNADRAFQRNLPMVGQVVVKLLKTLQW